MQQIRIDIENLKCGGCANSIRKAMKRVAGVQEATVVPETASVEVVCEDSVERSQLTHILQQLGYPEVGSVQGMTAVAAQLKSYVSCAIGRIQ